MRPLLRLSRVTKPSSRIQNIHTRSSTAQKPDLTTRLRQQIWGTDKPPGAADPYRQRDPNLSAHEDALEQAEAERLAAEEIAAEEAAKGGAATVPSGEYVPSTDARSMLVVGTKGAFMRKEWDPKYAFVPEKKSLPKVTSPEVITNILRRAVIEAYTSHLLTASATIPITSASFASSTSGSPLSPDDKFTLTLDPATREFLFLYSNQTLMHQTANGRGFFPAKIYKSAAEVWLSLPLSPSTPKITFNIVQKVHEMTGLRLPDPIISQQRTVSELLSAIIKHATKPQEIEHKTLAPMIKEALAKSSQEVGGKRIRNVTVFEKKVRPSDKETAIGRTETIEIITATTLKIEGEKKGDAYLRRRRLKAKGLAGVEFYPGIGGRKVVPEVEEEIEEQELDVKQAAEVLGDVSETVEATETTEQVEGAHVKEGKR